MPDSTQISTKFSDPKPLAAAQPAADYREAEVRWRRHCATGRPDRPRRGDRPPRAHQRPRNFGLARQADGTFRAVIDDMDRHANGTQWLLQLTQTSGPAAVLKYSQDPGNRE